MNFYTQIRPLFRDHDVAHMIEHGGFDLSNPAEVLMHSHHIIARLGGGTMPPDAPWPDADTQLLFQWIKENKVEPQRVITGVLFTKPSHKRAGTATISFDPPVVNGDAFGGELTATGPPGPIQRSPRHKIVSVRQFDVGLWYIVSGFFSNAIGFRIDDAWEEQGLRVSWSCKWPLKIHEISFLISGEEVYLNAPESAPLQVST